MKEIKEIANLLCSSEYSSIALAREIWNTIKLEHQYKNPRASKYIDKMIGVLDSSNFHSDRKNIPTEKLVFKSSLFKLKSNIEFFFRLRYVDATYKMNWVAIIATDESIFTNVDFCKNLLMCINDIELLCFMGYMSEFQKTRFLRSFFHNIRLVPQHILIGKEPLLISFLSHNFSIKDNRFNYGLPFQILQLNLFRQFGDYFTCINLFVYASLYHAEFCFDNRRLFKQKVPSSKIKTLAQNGIFTKNDLDVLLFNKILTLYGKLSKNKMNHFELRMCRVIEDFNMKNLVQEFEQIVYLNEEYYTAAELLYWNCGIENLKELFDGKSKETITKEIKRIITQKYPTACFILAKYAI
jgi:hypothetical protein